MTRRSNVLIHVHDSCGFPFLIMKKSNEEVPIQVQPGCGLGPPQKPHRMRISTSAWMALKLLPSRPIESLPPNAAPNAATAKDCTRSGQSPARGSQPSAAAADCDYEMVDLLEALHLPHQTMTVTRT